MNIPRVGLTPNFHTDHIHPITASPHKGDTMTINTFTAHGDTFNRISAQQRLSVLRNLNARLGESDGRVTLINALEAGLRTLPSPTRGYIVYFMPDHEVMLSAENYIPGAVYSVIHEDNTVSAFISPDGIGRHWYDTIDDALNA